jgi:cell division protein FtsQ
MTPHAPPRPRSAPPKPRPPQRRPAKRRPAKRRPAKARPPTSRAPARVAPRPRIDPRIRDRRVEVKRAEGRRRLRKVGAALVLLGLATAAVGAAFSPLLDIDRVRVVGQHGDAARAAEVRAAADAEVGSPLLFADTGAIEERVEALPWVANARVARHFPGTITVSVSPRTPVAWAAAADGTVRVVDRSGRVVATALTPPPGLLQLLGVDPSSTADTVAPIAARVAGAVPADIRAGVAGVVVEHDQAVLRLVNGTEVRLGAPRGVPAKARAAAAVLGSLTVGVPSYVDVRVPSAPVTG